VTNLATASATDPNEEPVTDTDTNTVPIDQNPEMAVTKTPNRLAVDAAGQVITYTIVVANTGNITLTGVVVDDPLLDDLALVEEPGVTDDGQLDVGETWTYTGTYTVQQTDIDENSLPLSFDEHGDGTVGIGEPDGDGDIDNTVTVSTNQTEDEEASAEVDIAAIDVEKFVSVDNGATWWDADDPTGPQLLNTTGNNPLFRFVVTNTGNVDLSEVTLTDSDFDIDTVNGDDTIEIGNLAAGAQYVTTFTGALWQFGQHSNTAEATGTYDVTEVVTAEISDTDDAHYFGMYGGLVTSSSLCTFDTRPDQEGDQFNLVFTPDYLNGSNVYKLASSNPGQFYYNVFYQGTAYDEVSFKLYIPYPFTTQGATPIHVYGDVDVDDSSGEICLEPLDALTGYKVDGTDANVIVSPADAFGEYTVVEINGVMTDADGFIYVNIHLDYDLKRTTGYTKSSPSSGIDNALNPAAGLPDILDDADYTFYAEADGGLITGSEDTVINDNVFKKSWGVGVLLQDPIDESPIAGEAVSLTKPDGVTVMSGVTDEDGWYAWNFKHTGKAATYEVGWEVTTADGAAAAGAAIGDDYDVDVVLGGSVKWQQVDIDMLLA
jgi:uncharacterized repeat protein (TIGR01451 family)